MHLVIKFYEDRLKIVISIANFRFFNMAAAANFFFGKGKFFLHFLIHVILLQLLVKFHDRRSTLTEIIVDVRFLK